jgi:hypothetical protein
MAAWLIRPKPKSYAKQRKLVVTDKLLRNGLPLNRLARGATFDQKIRDMIDR